MIMTLIFGMLALDFEYWLDKKANWRGNFYLYTLEVIFLYVAIWSWWLWKINIHHAWWNKGRVAFSSIMILLSVLLIIPVAFTSNWSDESFVAYKYKIILGVFVFLSSALNAINLFLIIKIFFCTDYPILPTNNRDDVLEEALP